MAYNITTLPTEADYRKLYDSMYCGKNCIKTHDGISVKFYSDRFDHAFFESKDRIMGDKSEFSKVRAERITWIKDTLEDATADLRVGWDKKTATYSKDTRVAIVKGDYVVIIWVKDATNAKFITAYKADKSIGKIKSSPKWKKIER